MWLSRSGGSHGCARKTQLARRGGPVRRLQRHAADVVADGRGFFAPISTAAADPRVLPCISHLHTPDGQRKATLKILQTSACQNNCNYCAFRAGRDIRRGHFAPDELARAFDLMHRAGRGAGHLPQLRRDRHEPDDGRDAGDGRVDPLQVRFPRLHPSEAIAWRRGRAHRTRRRPGRPRLGEPGSADADALSHARADETDGDVGGAIANGRRK